MNHIKSYLAGASALALALAAAAAPVAAAPDFAGKTITVITGFTSGATDTTARVYTRRMGKHLPGDPTIVIKGMPGAASQKAQSFVFEKAKADGLTVSFNPFQVMAQVTGAPGVRFKYEDFTFIGGVKLPPFVVVARTDVVPGGKLAAPADILKAQELKYTGRNPAHTLDILGLAALDTLGVDYAYVPGYRGAAQLVSSLMSHETNLTTAGLQMWNTQLSPTWDKDGNGKLLFYFKTKDDAGNYVNDPNMPPDVMGFVEFYQAVHGKAPSGELWDGFNFAQDMQGSMNFAMLAPPGTDPEVTAALREAFAKSANDPETIAEYKKIVGFEATYIGPDVAERVFDKLRNADPKLQAFWQDRMKTLTSR